MRIPAKFDSKCYVCRVKIAAGTMIDYNKAGERGRKTRCLACAALPAPATPTPTKGVYRRSFDSVAEYKAYVERPPIRGGNKYQRERVLGGHQGRGVSWYGVETIEQVQQFSRDGWPAGVAKMYAKLADLHDVPSPRSVRRTLVRGDQGDEFDIHAAYRGALDRAWSRRAKRSQFNPQPVTLIAHVLDNAQVSAETIFWRGAAVLRLADLLIDAGYSVTIQAAITSRNYGGNVENMIDLITVKDSTAPLDINSMASTLCMTGFSRVWGFLGIMSAADEQGCDVRPSYGTSCDVHKFIHADNRTFLTPDFGDADAARAWIAESISTLESNHESLAA